MKIAPGVHPSLSVTLRLKRISNQRCVVLSVRLVSAPCRFVRCTLLLLAWRWRAAVPARQGRATNRKIRISSPGKIVCRNAITRERSRCFEKALDVNPRSASAHFELGILYEQQQGDYAAALYHYQKAVGLRSDMLSADLARQRIQECKRELAKTVIQPLLDAEPAARCGRVARGKSFAETTIADLAKLLRRSWLVGRPM